jgi:PAS domain-containing protein
VLPDGTLCWQEWTDQAIFNEAGELIEYQAVGRDITERKELVQNPVCGDKSPLSIFWILPDGKSAMKQNSSASKAEEALRKSESMFKKVFEILPIGLWIADKNGKLMQGNPAGVKIWGMEPKVARVNMAFSRPGACLPERKSRQKIGPWRTP